ncbi:helix-turn-helix transcriptional regulator [Chelativorans salis]|uniref:LuxR family transcriptional regulator n=1 Tax=Chelativorans salis TaxID=2978478 RepID=A0ABT2LLZ2_9HYPH|nr:LuxR family transcriptional regulator [Chelativorans sp. EGI FJ00035]MCT7375606.1 LuxR family transcriptional regulator [Chelativorans sp. EGI FJ00035]
MEDAVFLVRDRLGLDHVTYMAAAYARPVDSPFICTTYPPQWVARYVLRRYLNVDPVVRAGFGSTRPFAWHELEWGEREQEFMADALDHGLGDKGYCIPVVDRAFRRSLLSLNTSMEADVWSSFIAASAPGLEKIARIIHDKAMHELSADSPAEPPLAPRQVECLLWTARGKEAKAIAAILDLSEFTVRSYLRTARQKLECRTLSQAVAKAIQRGIINP